MRRQSNPRDRYQEVIALLARTPTAQAASAQLTPPAEGGDILPGVDEALVRRTYNESKDTRRRLFQYLATRPDEWVPYSDISKALDYPSARELPGTLGAYGNRAKHRYENRWIFKPEERNGVWHAYMPGWVSEIIGELAGRS